jgi:hypothetical protein
MPRKRIGHRPMTDAERQARYRAAREAGKPIPRICCSADLRSRAQRWHDAVAVLVALQAQYAGWLEAMPNSLQGGITAEALRAIVDLDLCDLCELQAIDPPKGFGRD